MKGRGSQRAKTFHDKGKLVQKQGVDPKKRKNCT